MENKETDEVQVGMTDEGLRTVHTGNSLLTKQCWLCS